jgi:pSer/pThr/pTyr-binding forkhead associated (FHA) protein
MDQDWIILALRLLAALSLLGFLGVVAFALLRDYHSAVQQQAQWRQGLGRLVVIANQSPYPPFGAALPLLPSTTLGRSPDCTIPIADSYASQEHARLEQRLGQWWLEDQQSKNGTYLNGTPIVAPTVLSSGDLIQIGSLQLRLELE